MFFILYNLDLHFIDVKELEVFAGLIKLRPGDYYSLLLPIIVYYSLLLPIIVVYYCLLLSITVYYCSLYSKFINTFFPHFSFPYLVS